jgi:hypothetical protein
MIDKLDEMFKLQDAFMKRLADIHDGFPSNWPLDLTQKKNQIECKDLVFNSMQELFEAVCELKNSKKHRQTDVKECDRTRFCEECVDAFKFFLELLIFVGITPDEFYQSYCEKDRVINQRLDEKY